MVSALSLRDQDRDREKEKERARESLTTAGDLAYVPWKDRGLIVPSLSKNGSFFKIFPFFGIGGWIQE